MSPVSPAARRHLTVAVGTFGAQASIYLLLIFLSRRLGTADYSELASLFTLIVIGTIPGLAYQMWTARYVARLRKVAPGTPLPRTLVGFTTGLATLCTALTAIAVVVLSPVLDTPVAPALVGVLVSVPAMVVLAGVQGVIQGQDRVRRLAFVFILAGVLRLVGGVLADLWHNGPIAALIGQGLGLCLAAAIASTLVERPVGEARRGPTWLSVGRIVGAAGSTWVLANIDIVLARSVLDPHTAGLYSVGSLITRAVQFAPQFLVVSTFTLFANATRSQQLLRRAMVQLLAIGAVATAGAAVLGPTVIPLVLGHAYRELGHAAWGFAALGTLVALNQLLVAQRVARHDEPASLFVWGATALLTVGAVAWPDLTWTGLVALACAVNLALATALYARATLRERGRVAGFGTG